MSWQLLCETAGSTPLHPDDQLELLADHFLGSDLPFQGIAFIQFARAPYQFGYWHELQPFRIVLANGVSIVRGIHLHRYTQQESVSA